jgi:hypothetical protein
MSCLDLMLTILLDVMAKASPYANYVDCCFCYYCASTICVEDFVGIVTIFLISSATYGFFIKIILL